MRESLPILHQVLTIEHRASIGVVYRHLAGCAQIPAWESHQAPSQVRTHGSNRPIFLAAESPGNLAMKWMSRNTNHPKSEGISHGNLHQIGNIAANFARVLHETDWSLNAERRSISGDC